MIQEVVANSEVNETANKPVEGFNNIKPEQEMSTKEPNDAVNTEFNNAANEFQPLENVAPENYVDDNGKEYRIGDNLLPNIEFVKDANDIKQTGAYDEFVLLPESTWASNETSVT